jgi:polar amino acid transport system permease protein
MSFRLDVFLRDVFGFNFASAAFVTLWVSIAAMLLGMAVGLMLALMQQARVRPLRWLAWAYLWLFRGTPVLLQIIFAFNVLPSFGVILSGPVCAVLALGLHEAAYMTEIIRGGLGSVGAGQRDAARALGMSEWRAMRLVVLPQALRIAVPPIGNQFIGMLKLSALVSVIGVRELLLAAEQSASGTFRYLEALSAAGVYYLAFTTVLMSLQHGLERKLGRSVSPHSSPSPAGGRGPG